MKFAPRLLRSFLGTAVLIIAAAAPAAPPSRPKLVVAILVDQLRYDYLERFHDQFVENGFRLLMEHGAFMTFARYDYVPTITGPGHASFFSGSPPSMHGIIANDWFDKRTGKMTYCVGDAFVTPIGTEKPAGKMSPRNFIGGNFSDQMRLHYKSKVVGISMKDRGAILPAGRKPAGAYWWESVSGNFVTSSYYMNALPSWVQRFNARKLASTFVGQMWKRLLPADQYEREDSLPGEGNLAEEKTPTFDHVIAASKTEGFENIMPTPFGNELLLDFAKETLDAEKLGLGSQPDVFCVSFSSVDYGGHRFGPYSQEVQDLVLRLDRQLADFFGYLDQKVGLANTVIVLTADHGVAPSPEFAASLGLDGKRVDVVPMLADLVDKLVARFGTSKVLLTPRLVEGNLFFNYDLLREQGIAVAELSNFIRDWALNTGNFQAVYSREQILDGRTPGELGERVRNGFNAERSGDMVLIYKPYVLNWGGKTGTTHGSPYSYDTHVPVLFYGAPFVPGRYADDFHITDIAPTLSAALHIDPPAGSIGKPLVKLLAEEPGNHPEPSTPAPVLPTH